MSIRASGGWCRPVEAQYDFWPGFFTTSCVDPTVGCEHEFVCMFTYSACTWCGLKYDDYVQSMEYYQRNPDNA